jgi:hypothetical protein
MDTRIIFAALAALFVFFVVFAVVTSHRHLSNRPVVAISRLR